MAAPFPPDALPGLHAFRDGVWTSTDETRICGALLGHRMAVLRDSDNKLHLISPCAFNETLAEAIRAEGKVTSLLANSLMHDMYLRDWRQAFPEARFVAVPTFPEKIAGSPDRILDLTTRATLAPGIEIIPVSRSRSLQEVAVFHHPTRTLVVADLFFHYPEPPGPWSRIFFQLAGIGREPAPDTLYKLLLKDPKFALGALEEMRACDPTAILPCHGIPVTDGIEAALDRARAKLSR